MNIKEYMQNKPLLFDGAMGTYLFQKHPEAGDDCEIFNIEKPAWIQEIHREYLKAGAVAIKTNTFAANASRLESMDEAKRVICSGWKLASEAIADYEMEHPETGHFLFADMGPIDLPEEEDVFSSYKEVTDVFLECGARHFLMETMENADGVQAVADYIKEKNPDAFVVVSFGVSPDGFTRGGYFGRSLYHQMQQVDSVDMVGFNCVSGPKHLLDFMRKLDVPHMAKRFCVMPNAGYPTVVQNRTFYENNHIYFAREMQELLAEGASAVGGCCGTNPSYIKEIAQKMKESPVVPPMPAAKVAGADVEATQWKGTENAKNDFAGKLKDGEKVIVVELDPPVTPDVEVFMEGAARYKKAGVDAIDIADCPIARARIDSSILACKVTRELHLTTIPHLTCRDRNFNATKALLLGMNVEGVNNVLTVTGDPVPAAQRQEIKTVFSYNSAVLARHINTLNETTFEKNPFLVCGALNINAVNFDSQLQHAKRKIENGVNVLFTQPVMTENGLNNLRRAKRELPVKILGGLIPVVSYRNACFMEHEIAGISVDERIIALYKDKSREEGEELAVKIVKEIASRIKDDVDGFYLITPFQRISLMERIIKEIKKL